MGIRLRLRSIMPPTLRYFDSTVGRFRDHISAERVQLEHNLEQSPSLASVKDGQRAMREELIRINQTTAELKEAVASLRAALEYSDPEYLSLAVRKKKSKILLAGWYGADNCGDELMMRSILKHFEGKGVRVSVLLWDDPYYDAQKLPGFVDVIHYPRSIWNLAQLAESFDVLIWGGGAILDDNQYTDDPYNFNTGNLFIRLSNAMLDRSKRVYALGLSSNVSIVSGAYVEKLNRIVAESSCFSLRDEYSLRVLETAGVDCSRIKLCEDVVFADRDLNKAIELSSLYRNDASRSLFKVGVVLLCFDEYAEHNATLLNALSEYLSSKVSAFEIVLIPFYEYRRFDSAYLSALKERTGSPEWLSVVNYSSDLVSNPLLACDAAVCYRYHAALIAGVVGMPSLFVCQDTHPHYPNKIAHLADLFGYAENTVNMSCFDEGSFDVYFGKILPGTAAPKLDPRVIAESYNWIEGICQEVCQAVASSVHSESE